MAEETVYYSKSLGLRYKIKGDRVVTEDGLNYTREEIELFRDTEVGEVKGFSRLAHDVKLIFQGRIVAVEEIG